MNNELHLKLAELLTIENDIDKFHTFEFLDTINAADDLIGFKQVLRNLLEILPLLRFINSEQWTLGREERLLKVCNTFLEHEKSIGFLVKRNNKKKEDLFYKNTSNTNKLHGPVVSNPLYSALWSTRVNNKSSFLHLQAHYINAFHEYKKIETEKKEFNSARKTLSSLIRKLHNCDDSSELILSIPTKPISTKKLFNKLTSISSSLDNKINNKTYDELIRQLSLVLGIKSAFTKDKNKSNFNDFVIIDQFEDTDTELEIESHQVIKTSILKSNEITLLTSLGNSIEEAYSGPTFFKTDKTVDAEHGETIVDRVRKHKGMSRSIATKNQHLPYQWGRLNLLDIVSLNQGIEELRKKGTDQANELALVLNTMLWTSSSVKRALSLRVIKNIPKNTGHELYYCLNDN